MRPFVICVICVAAACGVASPTAAETYTRPYAWWGHPGDQDVLLLYRGNELVGVLDVEARSWRWTIDGKRHDLMAALYGPAGGRGAIGDLPAPPARKGTTPDEWRKRFKDAGIPIPAELDRKAGIEESPGSGPDDRRHARDAGDLIDGSPRKQDYRLGGVDASQIAVGPRYKITDHGQDRLVGPAEALSAIAAGTVPDDANHVRLTVIGAQAACDQVRRDLDTSPDLAYWRGKLVVNCYRPDHWRVRDGGFVVPADASQPVIYVQQADGKVLWRQDDYAGGAEAFAKALRDRVPGYDPNKDPNPKRPGPPITPAGGMSLSAWWLAVPASVMIALYVSRRRQTQPLAA